MDVCRRRGRTGATADGNAARGLGPARGLRRRDDQQRGRHSISGCRIKVEATAPQTDPRSQRIDALPLAASTARAVERAIALSHERYCSATAMLGKTAEITTSYELLAAAAG